MTKEIGFDTIDIFADPLDHPRNPSNRPRSRPTATESGLPIVSVACVAVGLIDFNPSVQPIPRRTGQILSGYVQGILSAKNLLLVLGEYIWQKEVIPPAEQWDAGVTQVRDLGRYAADLGLEIALELEPFDLSLLNDVASMAKFLGDVAVPAVKANLDISHLVLAHQSPDLVEQLRGKIAHVHISDCDGRVHGDLPPGRGVVDFPPYLDAIGRLGLDGATISIELEYSPEPARGSSNGFAKPMNPRRALMKAAGLRG